MKRTHVLAVAAIAIAAMVGLAACSAIPSGSPQPAASARSGQGGPGRGGGFGAGFPGVIGTVAAVNGSTIQVQSVSSQTAVSWSSATRFTDQAAASSTALAVGECVVARPARSASGGAPSTTSTVTAATVEITPSTGGSCGFAALGGGRVSPRPGTGQGTAPNPGATPGGRRGFGAVGAIGMISSVGSNSFVVQATARAGSPQRTETVNWTSSTTFSKLEASTAAAVQVGVCVTAQGKTDDTGALAATTIAVSQPVNGSCTGFGGFGRGGQGGSGQGGSGSSGSSSGSAGWASFTTGARGTATIDD